MTQDLAKKKRLVLILYVTLFLGLFSFATYVKIQGRIEDAKHARDVAPTSTAAPVTTR